jgi:hypothetical protein
MTVEQTMVQVAEEELNRIDRYFSKNWMDEDYPSDSLWELLTWVKQILNVNSG